VISEVEHKKKGFFKYYHYDKNAKKNQNDKNMFRVQGANGLI